MLKEAFCMRHISNSERESVMKQRVPFQETLHTVHFIWKDKTSFVVNKLKSRAGFEAKREQAVPIMGTGAQSPGKTALHLASSLGPLYIGSLLFHWHVRVLSAQVGGFFAQRPKR